MEKKFNIIIRLIPLLACLGTVITLALLWTEPENRDGIFYYFLFLMIYACIMLFFSDIIFLGGKKPLHVRIPVLVISLVHFGYLVVILILRVIFANLSSTYFILATIVATSVQISLSLWIYKGVVNIRRQQDVLDQNKNVKVNREILLMDLTDNFKRIPTLAGNAEMMRKLELFCNTWKYSSEKDTENTLPLTEEINRCIQMLSYTVSTGNTVAEMLTGELARITSLIERRNKLLQMK